MPVPQHHVPPSYPTGRTGHDDEIDLLAVLRVLRRNLALIGAIAATGTVAAVIATMFMTPMYSATTVVRVDPSQPTAAVGSDPGTVSRGSQVENAIVEGNVAMLESPALMRRIAERLDLGSDPEFVEAAGPAAHLKSFVGAFLSPERDDESRDPNAKAAGALSRNIEAHRVGLTYLVELTAWSRDPGKAAEIANATLDSYLEGETEAERHSLSRINEMLRRHIAELREQLQDSEREVQRYKAEVGLMDGDGATLNEQQMSALNAELVAAQGRAAEARARYEQLRDVSPDQIQSAVASPDVLSSEVIANLRTSYAEVSRRVAEQNSQYGPNHPAAVAANAELANVSQQMTAELGRIVASAEAEYRMARARQESVAASLEEVKTSGGALDHEVARLNELEREAEANRELYQSVLQRAKETAAAQNLQVSGVRIVSAATPPGAPSAPRRTLIVALGLVGGLGLGVAAAVGREIMSTGFHRAEDLRNSFGFYPLASVPMVGSGPGPTELAGEPAWLRSIHRSLPNGTRSANPPPAGHDVSRAVLAQPESPFSESIRSLRYSLRRLADSGHDMRVVMVTSAMPGEGKSTVATSLAREADAAGERVLLIDADLRRPDLAAMLGLAPSAGLAGVLEGTDEIAGLIQHDSRSNVSVIAGNQGLAGPRALQMLSSTAMTDLLRIARRNFDLVVLDTAPLVPIADPRVLVDRVDGVVMVVASDQTSRETVMAALHETPGLDERLVGMVLNRMTGAPDRYVYGAYDSAATG